MPLRSETHPARVPRRARSWSPDGTWIAIDKQLDVKELPKAVAKTLEEKYPKAKYDVIEEVTKKEKIEYYEVELTTADNDDRVCSVEG